MSAISRPRPKDPRVVRSRAAVIEAARTLFLKKGYAGTTMEEVAEAAGLTKRTVYNNYGDKEALFTDVAAEVITYAERFASGLPAEFEGMTGQDVGPALRDFGRRLALAILRPEIIALRRLLIGEARAFPQLARGYFDRAPGRVLRALATGFRKLGKDGLVRVEDPRRAAEQFAYLVVGAPLDKAILVGTVPAEREIVACAEAGVETFLARYGVTARAKGTTSTSRLRSRS